MMIHFVGHRVAGVGGDATGTGVNRSQRLVAGMGLDHGQHAQGMSALDEGFEDELVQTGVQHEQIAPVGAGLVNLVGGDHQVVDEHRHIDRTTHGVEVGQGSVRASGASDHRHARRTARLVEAGQDGDITHPYDNAGPGEETLRGSTDLVARELAEEVAARIAIAGLEVVETRISSLAYAPEIAHAMLQRQQASAVIAAREKIVEGAVTMVQKALSELEDQDIVSLDDERKASMVSNLLVVLCSDSRATPVVNTGSLYT